MPTPRTGLAAGVVNGILYAVGGNDGVSFLGTVEAYDPATNTWTTKASMPTVRTGLATGVVNGILYAVGGNDGSFLATVEAYDPATNTWTTKDSMPTARTGLAAGVVNGILYAVGGNDGMSFLGTVEAYDPATNTWTTKASMPTVRTDLAAEVVNGILYAVGGNNGPFLGTVEAYRVTNTWTTKAPMLTARHQLAAGVVNGILYAVGGYNGSFLPTVEAFDPADGPVTYYSTNFTDGTPAPLVVDTSGGGVCVSSTAFHDPGSASSMKCTVPGGTGGAELRFVFTSGDPTLDSDLFQEIRFVLDTGAAASIGGLSCDSSSSTPPQFKTHKSTYGNVGSAVNGWVMSQVAPCQGPPGIFNSAEMWDQPGVVDYPWPNTFPSLNEGSVYDVVYRYHRNTTLGCGTMAVWVNGTNVEDTPCLDYMGVTNGSPDDLTLRDGALYLQAGSGPYTVYTLFTQATNYPIGAATASP